ncbi:hypothetical protein J422_04163, partial [Methanocaldococcus villosus KIN24-T80]
PYALPGVEKRFLYLLIILGVIVIISYIQKLNKLLNFIINTLNKIFKPIISLSVGQKFVLLAIIFLIISAIDLILRGEHIANVDAIIAYYFLVIGVLNLLFEYWNESFQKLRIIVSLILLSVLIYYTPEVTKIYPKAYYLPIIILILFLVYQFLRKFYI